jgi:hypothetical protein
MDIPRIESYTVVIPQIKKEFKRYLMTKKKDEKKLRKNCEIILKKSYTKFDFRLHLLHTDQKSLSNVFINYFIVFTPTNLLTIPVNLILIKKNITFWMEFFFFFTNQKTPFYS